MMAGHGPEEPSPSEIQAMPEYVAWESEMRERGVLRGGARLRPPSDATTVRVRDGELLLSDGPFAETKEQMGGYEIVECVDLAEAIEIAGAHPGATDGMIEVRPFWSE
jgi:hypothetical protein